MKTGSRLALLGACAGAGLGIALAIGLSFQPPAADPPGPSGLAAGARTESPALSPAPIHVASGAGAPWQPPAGNRLRGDPEAPLRPAAEVAGKAEVLMPRWATPARRQVAQPSSGTTSGRSDGSPGENRKEDRVVAFRVREPETQTVRDHFSDRGLTGRFLSEPDDPLAILRTLEEYRRLSAPLDRIGARTYQPKHLAPVDLQMLLQPLLTDRSGTAGLASRVEIGGPTAIVVGNPGGVGGPIVVVRDAMSALDRIDQVVALIDVPPPQVRFEATVASVKLGEAQSAGIDFELLRQKRVTNPAPASGGLKLAYLEGTAPGLFEAVESIGPTAVLATPRLTVAPGDQAEMVVGEMGGKLSAAISAAGAGAAPIVDGTRLRLRPLISGDGMVRLEIQPDAAEAGPGSGPAMLAFPEGATLLIGGLVCQQKTLEAPPPSKHSPLAMFKKPAPPREKVERFEILVLLTASAVPAAPGDAAAMARLAPDARCVVADGYFRAAINAEAVGDRASASRFIDLALRFDPSRRAAADFRGRLRSGAPGGAPVASSRSSLPAACRRLPPVEPDPVAVPASFVTNNERPVWRMPERAATGGSSTEYGVPSTKYRVPRE